jgi:hypothetical protein
MSNVAFHASFVAFATAMAFAMAFARDAFAQGWEANVEQSEVPPAAETEAPAPSSPSVPIYWELGADTTYVTPPIHGGTNPFGFGLGGHLGIEIADVYAGARVVDFLGGTDVDVSYRSLLAGIELGYDVRARLSGRTFLLLRPEIGAGDAVIYYTDPSLAKVDVVTTASGSSSSSTSDTLTVNSVYLEPGATLMLSSGLGYLSINGNVLLLPGIVYGGAGATTWVSYGSRISGGLRF